MTKLYVDIETYSAADLKTAGVYRYAEDPSFLILMAAWAIDDGPVQVAVGAEAIDAIPGLWDDCVLKVAHNAAFERICFSRFSGAGRYLDPVNWHDTMAVAAEWGYPRALGVLARWLGCAPKDEAGTRLISLFCKPNRKGERNLPENYPDEWMAFVDYCAQDVVTLREVDQALGPWPTEMERQVYLVDQRINDRGVAVDLTLAQLAVDASAVNAAEQVAEICELTGVDNPNSQPQMMAWVRREELDTLLPDMRSETISAALETALEPHQRRALELRQELALAAVKKYTAALVGACGDGRLRGTLSFFGAHTGRWSGRGLQLQNLPRLAFKTTEGEHDATGEMAVILDLLLGLGASSTDLKKLVRALLLGPFTVVDYASIEARVIAWLAGEQWALDAFADGRDIYVETAQRMGGLTRAQGKVAVLALGYQGAVRSLRAMGAEGDDDTLQAMVDQWRAANRRIVGLWGALGNAVGEPGRVGKHLRISRSGERMHLHLPSGRAIVYHGMRWERFRVVDPVTGKTVIKEGYRYDDPRGHGRIPTYGGRLAENATQAVARDLLAEGLVRLEDRGYTVVGHVHDEFITEGVHDVAVLARTVSELPAWAKGLPVSAEGFVCERYHKG